MRIERSKHIEHLGAVKIHDVRRLLELDSGVKIPGEVMNNSGPQRIEREVINAIQRKLSIVLPVKDEDLKLFEGVLSGIPHDCQMIVMSNSQRGEIDNLQIEKEILERFCVNTERTALIIHQKDPQLAKALAECGYSDILGDDGLVRNGKSEGMIIGILLALMQDKEYIGFIDTDNYIPGAVWEYAQHYAIGFSLAESPYAMVRILWRYKPKMHGELYFKKWGRVSEITNRHINSFISSKGKFETDVIKTANAGEHAMSLQLATKLEYATGYGVETQELMAIFEQFGGSLPITDETISKAGVDIIQTETINPHLHEERSDTEHLIQDMLLPSLSVIYHNLLCQNDTKEAIRKQLIDSESIRPDEKVKRIRMLPRPEIAHIDKFAKVIEENLVNYCVPKEQFKSINLPILERKAKKVMKLVFTDLDGTLLHSVSYSYAVALDAIRKLQEADIPIIFCSAKTMQEQQIYRHELSINTPFIVENGSAIMIPKDYFHYPFSYNKTVDDYHIIELGIGYEEVKKKLKSLSDKYESKISCFGDLSTEEVSKLTGLNLQMAELAKKRDYSETVIIEGKEKQVKADIKTIQASGLHCIFGGKFYEVYDGADKGKAIKILMEMYKLNFGDIYTIGIGDSANDAEMLEVVEMPMLVKSVNNQWQRLRIKKLTQVDGIGPEGWSKAADFILSS